MANTVLAAGAHANIANAASMDNGGFKVAVDGTRVYIVRMYPAEGEGEG